MRFQQSFVRAKGAGSRIFRTCQRIRSIRGGWCEFYNVGRFCRLVFAYPLVVADCDGGQSILAQSRGVERRCRPYRSHFAGRSGCCRGSGRRYIRWRQWRKFRRSQCTDQWRFSQSDSALWRCRRRTAATADSINRNPFGNEERVCGVEKKTIRTGSKASSLGRGIQVVRGEAGV